MLNVQLSEQQRALAALPADRRIFLEGVAGTGKTSAAVARLEHLLRSGVPGGDVLLVLPQRTLAAPYDALLRKATAPAGGEVTTVTIGGLGQRMIELYWPLVAASAGFAHPERPPVFLTLETAQYFMARVIRPMLERGAFDSIRVERNRLYSQILDNLNKAAVVGFGVDELAARLKGAWLGESAQLRVYDEGQEAATRFRAYCLQHNLLDFSLQYEMFHRRLWPLQPCRQYLLARYRHLIVDNVEEDTPVSHDILAEWLPHARSALVVYDVGGGYRRFLGADPESGYRLKALCEEQAAFETSFVMSGDVQALGRSFRRGLRPRPNPADTAPVMGRRMSPVLAAELDFDAPAHPSTSLHSAQDASTPLHSAQDASTPLHSAQHAVVGAHEHPERRPSQSDGPESKDAVVGAHERPSTPLHSAQDASTPLHSAQDASTPLHSAQDASTSLHSAQDASTPLHSAQDASQAGRLLNALEYDGRRYHHQMLDWVADRIAVLVQDEGVRPGEIAVVAPFVSGGLRFALENRLAAHGVAVRSHRPSRALREEPTTLCLLTWAALCHPGWKIRPAAFDVAQALMLTIADMDLVRAQLLADIAYRTRDGVPVLTSFAEIEPPMQERITFLLGGRYEGLRSWLNAHTVMGEQTEPGWASARASRTRGARSVRRTELDHFLSRLFGEMLSQPGYGFHESFDAGELTAKVIESARKFRQVMAAASGSSASGDEGGGPLGREYIELVRDGVVAAQYVRSWQRQPEDAVLIAPAYTFLMSNQPVDHQFWLDVGATGWWERLNQPITHPYVLSRRWEPGHQWTDLDEYFARQEAMAELVIGLVHRCRKQVHLALSELSESGSDQRGNLLRTVQSVLRQQSLANH